MSSLPDAPDSVGVDAMAGPMPGWLGSDIARAVEECESAIRQLQATQEIAWKSAAADVFRTELYGLIRDVREVHRRALVAQQRWFDYEDAANLTGEW